MKFNDVFKNIIITGVHGAGKNLLAHGISTDFIEINDVHELEGLTNTVAVMHSDKPVEIRGYINIHCSKSDL